MFDGLKDKLNSFTEDVEADAETPEDAAKEEPDAEPDRGSSDSPETAGNPPSEVEEEWFGDDSGAGSVALDEADTSEAGTTERDQPDPDDGTAAGDASGNEPEGTAAGEAKTVDADADAGDEADPADSDDRSLTERAKLFATGKTVIDEGDLADHLEELEFELLGSDVEMTVAQEILDNVEQNLTGDTRRRLDSTGNLVQDALREALYEVISVGQFDFDERIAEGEKPVVIIFTGVNGVGKTTTIAKLSRYLEERGYSSVLANGDTFRAGANEQLEQHARNLDKKIISHEQGSDPAAVIYDGVEYAKANGVDVVLGDTAGRLHTSEGLMDQLEKIDRVIGPDMTIFVDEAVAGQDAVNQAREFDEASDIDGTVLTKADTDAQGGAAISVAHVTGKPILFLGTGQDYEDLERFDPERIVDELLGAD